MSILHWAIIVLGAFVAIWMLFVVPAERRHHERKLEIIQKKLAKRRTQTDGDGADSSAEVSDDGKVS